MGLQLNERLHCGASIGIYKRGEEILPIDYESGTN
jgi:hypothetical protein